MEDREGEPVTELTCRGSAWHNMPKPSVVTWFVHDYCVLALGASFELQAPPNKVLLLITNQYCGMHSPSIQAENTESCLKHFSPLIKGLDGLEDG